MRLDASLLSRRDACRRLAVLAIGAPAVLRGRYRPVPWARTEYSARAMALMEQAIAVDMLDQFRFDDYAEQPPKATLWLTRANAFTDADDRPYGESHIRVFALGHGVEDYASAVKWAAQWNGFIASYDQWFMRIDDPRDFERTKADRKVGIMLTLQNSDHFRTPADVDDFYALGQRLSQLTYNFQNRIGSGFLEQVDAGLTVFGQSIVDRMQAVGMAVDVSHCGDRTTLDTLAAAKRPVVFSHASCRALVPGHLRCKTDEMIRKMAATGGVMGIPFLRFVIKPAEPVTIEDVLDHFDHVVRLVGVEHVGVGSDMDVVGNPNPVTGGRNEMPSGQPNFDRYHVHADAEGKLTIKGLDHPLRMYDLTEGLIRRKYSDPDILLMLGGNWVRAMSALWTV
ncbi:MAG TPA: membrane dipeptidase [Gemmatimonadaceae bacterium]|nr:membrane dipeptidase [Gemmatimonadaceae bacterium]